MSGTTPDPPPPDDETPELMVTPELEVVPVVRWSGGKRRRRDHGDAGDGGPILPPLP